MIRRTLLIASVVVLPSLATAQGGGGGGRTRSTQKDEMFDKKDKPAGPALRVRDIEDQSPIRLLIDKRKDLKLTDAQLAQLKDSETKLKETNAPLLKGVDSLVREMRVPFSKPSDEEAARIRDARVGLMSVIKTVQANYDASAKEATAGMDADQQAKANDLLAKLRADGDKMLRERLGGGGGGGRGGV